MPQPMVIVSIEADSFQTDIETSSHVLTADEPASVGGGGAGPNPYELLLAALGACSAMTIRLEADRKGWPLQSASLALRHERRHAEDCVECDDPSARLDHIDIDLQLQGDLTDEQRDRLREVADRCPVHKTLTGDLRITTKLIDKQPHTE